MLVNLSWLLIAELWHWPLRAWYPPKCQLKCPPPFLPPQQSLKMPHPLLTCLRLAVPRSTLQMMQLQLPLLWTASPLFPHWLPMPLTLCTNPRKQRGLCHWMIKTFTLMFLLSTLTISMTQKMSGSTSLTPLQTSSTSLQLSHVSQVNARVIWGVTFASKSFTCHKPCSH